MIDKKSIIKMADDVFHRSQGYPDRRLVHPQREWGIGLFVFAVLVISGSILVGTTFVQYRSADSVKGSSEASIPQYREVITQDALELYRARSSEYRQLRGDIVVVPVELPRDASSTVSDNAPALESEEDVIGTLEIE